MSRLATGVAAVRAPKTAVAVRILDRMLETEGKKNAEGADQVKLEDADCSGMKLYLYLLAHIVESPRANHL